MAALEQPLERNRRVPLHDRAMDDYQIAGVGLVERERLQMWNDCREIENGQRLETIGNNIPRQKEREGEKDTRTKMNEFPLIEADLYRTESGAISPILVQPTLIASAKIGNRD